MEPYTKKRKLAPKAPESISLDQGHQFEYPPPPSMNVNDAMAPQQTNAEIDTFARNLQDAASMAYTQISGPTTANVSALLLHWADDASVNADLTGLEAVLREEYHFKTETWGIPTVPNPAGKLLIRIAQHIQFAKPGDLLILYYAGHSFGGTDSHSYWACPGENSLQIKWDGVRSLVEDAELDVLFLLDCGFSSDVLSAGKNGVKEGIAAFGLDNSIPEYRGTSFTFGLIEALQTLRGGPPFTVKQLHEKIMHQQHLLTLEHSTVANGNSKSSESDERMPVSFTLTPNMLQTITLMPSTSTGASASYLSPTIRSPERMAFLSAGPVEQSSPVALSGHAVFAEARALVSYTFEQEHSDRLAAFKDFISSTPAIGAQIYVEGFFPDTSVFILSMPTTLWGEIKNDNAGMLLGFVKSHNCLRESRKWEDIYPARMKDFEDGRMLLEARAAAISSPAVSRTDHQQAPTANMAYQLLGDAVQAGPESDMIALSDQSVALTRKSHVEDSEEMHEAAIQLKALSHVRTVNHEGHGHSRRSHSLHANEEAPSFRGIREASGSSQDIGESGGEDHLYSESNLQTSRPKGRRSTQKQSGKQDTACSLCSHAPFKDSSSLRKHVAAAHTRPFPCAFSFAGCTSTFGSKNEWKRHIASQHLCLTFYRCSDCPQSTVEGKGNEFNRKDLFTQHLRRMHAPFAIKKATNKADSKLQLEWEGHVKKMQGECLVIRRSPPLRSACPKPDCSNVFEGVGSWEDWTEHVGRHMEKGEASRLGVDRLLAKWALDEGIIERKEDGEYKLCGTDRENSSGGSYYPEGASKGMIDDKLDDAMLQMDDGR